MLPNFVIRVHQTLPSLATKSIASKPTLIRNLATTNQQLVEQNNNKQPNTVIPAPSRTVSKLKEIKDLDNELKPCRALLYPNQMEWLDERQVRISRPSKNVMQSGTAYMSTWRIEFNSQQRWENWLMGWTSTGDPVSNLTLNFPTKEAAIAFCDKNELAWFVEEQPERRVRRKSYADNFSWNKRTRLGSK